MLKITIRYFAQLREQRGKTEETIECPTGTTVGELFEQLFGNTLNISVGYAVNHEQVEATTALSNGDEVAFLPPIGGG